MRDVAIGPNAPVTPDATRRESGSGLLQISVATAVLLSAPSLAYAGFIPPAGVSAYRLAFVTADGFSAASPSISTYNNDVTNEAHLDMQLPKTVSWSALASVSGTSASANVSCGAACNALPIYLVDGTLIGTISSLFAGTNSSTIDEDQNGVANVGYVWTGSNSDGTADVGSELGSSAPEQGWNAFTSTQLNFFTSSPSSETYSIYAVSSEILVTTPEPASTSALLVGGLIVTRVFRRRSK